MRDAGGTTNREWIRNQYSGKQELRMNSDRRYRLLFTSMPFGGIEVFFRNMQRLLEKRPEFECHWVWVEKEPKELIARIPPFSLNWTIKGSLITKARVRDLEKRFGPFDVALSNNVIPMTFMKTFRRRVPLILSLDNTPRMMDEYEKWYMDNPRAKHALVEKWKRKTTAHLLHDAACVLPWTSVTKRSLQNDYAVDGSKMEIIPPGVDLQKWKRNSDSSARSSFTVLFVGGAFLRKGGDVLLNVARQDRFSDTTFHFVTVDSVTDKPDNVIVHHSISSNSPESVQLFNSADVFVMPTRADFAPTNSVCEAMAMGLPVITSNVGGLDEVVRDGEHGFIVPIGDEATLADRLLKLKSSTDLRKRMGANARAKAEKEFDLAINIERILNHAVRLAEKSRSNATA